jgi:hypothetical protein
MVQFHPFSWRDDFSLCLVNYNVKSKVVKESERLFWVKENGGGYYT